MFVYWRLSRKFGPRRYMQQGFMLKPELTSSCASSIRGAQRPFSTGVQPPLAGSSCTSAVGIGRRPETVGGRMPGAQPSFGASASTGTFGRRSMGMNDEAGQALAFDRMYDHLMREESGFVGELERFLDLHEQVNRNKTKALFTTWEADVFGAIQTQVMDAVNAIPAREGQRARAKLMQEYLDVGNKKARGVFRDIVIESEYDPLSSHKNGIKVDARLRHDPCKLELRKHAAPSTSSQAQAGYSKPNTGGPEPRMDSAMWDKLEATPYGRLGKLVRPENAPPYALQNRVAPDQYKPAVGLEALQKELPLGKRCFRPRSSIQGVLSHPEA